jgi:hypothetical protein
MIKLKRGNKRFDSFSYENDPKKQWSSHPELANMPQQSAIQIPHFPWPSAERCSLRSGANNDD